MLNLRERWARLVAFLRRDALDRDFDEELAAHVEMATDDYLRQGVPQAEARRRALAGLGGEQTTKQTHRETRGLPSLDALLIDLRHAVRSLRRSPGFTITAVATLAVGLGANVAVFTITNAVLFKNFPLVHQGDRLAYIASRGPGHGPFISYPDFRDWRQAARSFEDMAAINAVRLSLGDEHGFPVSVNATQVTANTFALLGQRPVLGRDFVSSDEHAGSAPVAILSDGFWERRYARDSSVIGQTVRLDGTPTTIVGVMARGFSFPRTQELWIPLVPTPELERRDARGLWFAFGRLARDTTIDGARAELDTIGNRLANAYPQTNRGLRPAAMDFHDFFVGSRTTTMHGVLWAAVGFLLLIACANLANLLLGRAVDRAREMSVHAALGAGRARIARRMLVESLLLSTLGAALGWLSATWAVRIYEVTAGPPGWFDRTIDYAVDGRVFLYLAAVTVGSTLLFGLAPALRLARLNINATLNDGGGGAAGGRGTQQLSAVLVAAEMALAVVLLAGAGTMTRSLLNLYTTDVGVRTSDILTTFIELPGIRYPDQQSWLTLYERLTTRLAALPGVESVALADRFPTQGARRVSYELAGIPMVDRQDLPQAAVLAVDHAYFSTLELPLTSGRAFTEADSAGAPVAIVNQRFVREHRSDGVPIGERLRVFDGQQPGAWLTIVGVVPNVLQDGSAEREAQSLLYLPHRQVPGPGRWLFIRTQVAPEFLAAAVRHEVQALDRDLPMFDFLPLDARLAANYRASEVFGGLLITFAAIALLLASIGLYAVVAHAVRRRTREIGVRIAMGATRQDVLALVFSQSTGPVGAGLGLGLIGSLALTPLLSPMLAHVSPTEPATLVTASAVLLVGALLGCLVPARRATRVDPVVALRHE